MNGKKHHVYRGCVHMEQACGGVFDGLLQGIAAFRVCLASIGLYKRRLVTKNWHMNILIEKFLGIH
jgi:hypothetical protein